MEKITKTYVEKLYKGLLFSESLIEEVEDRNPINIENDGKILGFRFLIKNIL